METRFLSSFWSRVARLAGLAGNASSSVTRRPAKGTPGAATGEAVAQFIAGLRGMATTRGELAAGAIHVINLDRVRESFTSQGRWEVVAKRVETLCTTIIGGRLDSVDMMLPLAGPAFLIAFGRLKAEEARAKCVLMAQEIERRLLGWDPAFHAISVRAEVVRLDKGEIGFAAVDTAGETQRLAALAEHTQVTTRQTCEPVMSTIKGRRKASDPAWTPNQHDSHAFDNPWIVDIAPPAGKGGRSDGHWYYEALPARPDQLSFVYLPMWHIRRRAIGTHLCLPAVSLSRNQMLVGDAIYAAASPLLICEIDIHLLSRVAEDLGALLAAGKQSMLGVPVHFETLARARERRRYLACCARLPEATRRYLAIELVDTPEGAPPTRLAELLGYVRPFARILNIRTSLGHIRFEPFAAAKAFAVGVALGREERTEGDVIARMNAFTIAAERLHLRTYAFELRSRSLASAALGAGFDYISGTAVGSTLRAPESAYRFETADLYADIVGEPASAGLT